MKCATPSCTRDDGTTAARVGARLDKRPEAAYYAVGNASSHDAARDRTTQRGGVMGGEDVPGERSSDPRDLLPLTPVALNVLLALADGERHGYGIMLEVRERTGGGGGVGAGARYWGAERPAGG